MIRAGLLSGHRENGLPLAIGQIFGFQFLEMPLNKGIEVWIQIGGDEGPSPIHCGTKALHVLDGQRWEIFQPVGGIRKFGNLLLRNSQGQHDVVLIQASRLCHGLGLLSFEHPRGSFSSFSCLVSLVSLDFGGFGFGGVASFGNAFLEFQSSCSNGHPGAVKAEGKKHTFAIETCEAGGELCFGDGKGMAQMQLAIHVGEREGHKIFLRSIFRSIHFICLLLFPKCLHLLFDV
mmetsp:Transcript_81190/g.165359  ORF Transcript_81190/g.165359 Transcript_81190/m.165359 type:complete len:233 (+) Transcript_81190:2464-3162(+)